MKKIFLPSLKHRHHQGFVLLFALVVSAIIFFIGAGIFSISFKELIISSISRESQKSIFAADSGVECALWADTNGILPLQTEFESCFGGDISNYISVPTISFSVYFPESQSCARVSVLDGATTAAGIERTVTSRGYNKCNAQDGEPIRSYAGLAERLYQVSYFR